MTATSVAVFKQKCSDYFDHVIQHKDSVTVTTKHGNAVVLSEELYNGLVATLALSADPRFYAELKSAIDEPLEECLDSSEVEW
ncbi:MAG: type II toxin-antitoxin system Phd/YefM family antitoxin [Chitinispirillales bacterium]|nr:type II toxin-antitoxin system Phd/YefM family antitoxin [Chitinispirillales bacterium]